MVAATKQHVFDTIKQLQPCLLSLGVRRLGLFGSFVNSAPSENSDVDLLIEFLPGRKDFTTLMTVGDLLEQHLGRRVELVTPESLSRHFGDTITAEAEYVDLSA